MNGNKKVRVITVGNSPLIKGGITSVISQIMSHDWEQLNIDMKFIPTFNGGNALNKIATFLNSYVKLYGLCANHQVDVIHMHMSHAGSFTRKYFIHKLCQKYGIADIIHLHSSSFVNFYENASSYRKKKIRKLLTECKCVLALGREWERRVKKIAPNANVYVMNNTIAIPDKCVDESQETVSFLYLGVLVKRKGVIDLLKAINMLKETGALNSTKVIFNIGGTGECEADLKDYTVQHKLEQYVHYLGWVSGEEKRKQLENNMVLVLPSYNEGLPISILEAISYGMPVIATNVGSVAEAVHNGENGILYEAGDIQALYEAIKQLIESETKRIEYGKISRKLAEDRFDDKKYFERLNELYRQICQ